MGVCLYPINVKTAEPIEPKLCVGQLQFFQKAFDFREI